MYDANTRQLDLNNRPNFIISDPNTMVHPVAMLHHRISWSVLGGALNGVLNGSVDKSVINALLKLTPGPTGPTVIAFSTALTQVLAQKNLSQTHIDAINRVEELVFSLPCNLFLGPNNRSDDPGANIDFLPGDVESDGNFPRVNGQITALGQAEKTREALMNHLMNATRPRAVDDIDRLCAALAKQYVAVAPPLGGLSSLSQATGYTPGLWNPAVGMIGAYRNWPGGLTIPQSNALNVRVMDRVGTSS